MFQNRLASLTSVINDSRSDLDAALSDLSVAIGEVQRFVAGTRDQTAEQIQRLGSLTQVLVDNRLAFENVLHITPNAIANFNNIYYPQRRCGDRRILARQLLESGLARLRHDRRRREHHRARNGETLRAVPRVRRCGCSTSPAFRCRSTPTCGLPSIRTGSSTPIRSSRPEAQGRVIRPSRRRRCPPTPARAISRRRPARNGPPPGPARDIYAAHGDGPATSVACGDQQRAADPGPPHIISNIPAGPPTVDGMLLPPTPAPARIARCTAAAGGRDAAVMIRPEQCEATGRRRRRAWRWR